MVTLLYIILVLTNARHLPTAALVIFVHGLLPKALPDSKCCVGIYRNSRLGESKSGAAMIEAIMSTVELLRVDSIYDTSFTALVQDMRRAASIKPEFTKAVDPDYLTFVSLVQGGPVETVRPWKLYALWWISRTFRRNWHTRPTEERISQMAWGMFHYLMAESEIECVLDTYIRLHGQRPNRSQIETTIELVGKDAAPSLTKMKARLNAKRRKKYQMTHETTKKGRPDTLGIRSRILELVTVQPATPAFLCAKIPDANANTVRYHLRKLKQAGAIIHDELQKQYFLNPNPKETPIPAPQMPKVQSVPPPPKESTMSEAEAQKIARRGHPFIPPAGCRCGGCSTGKACWKLEAYPA
jgi:hypothetical protein